VKQYEGSAGLPTTYFITREGRIRQYYPGALSFEQVVPVLEELLREAAS
jgi:hypothetical protein